MARRKTSGRNDEKARGDRSRPWRKSSPERGEAGDEVSNAQVQALQQALRNIDWKFRDIFEDANDAIFLHLHPRDDLKGRFIEVNRVACDRLGYTRDELLTMAPADINDPESVRDVESMLEEFRATGRTTIERVHVSKEGRKIPVEISSRLLESSGRQVVLSIARDITVRKQAEDALRRVHGELEHRVVERTAELADANARLEREMAKRQTELSAILRNVPTIVVVLDRERRVRKVNRVACERLGYSHEELLRMTPIDIDTPEYAKLGPKRTEGLLECGEPFLETAHVRRAGARRC